MGGSTVEVCCATEWKASFITAQPGFYYSDSAMAERPWR